mgnify:CR=1 FL=1
MFESPIQAVYGLLNYNLTEGQKYTFSDIQSSYLVVKSRDLWYDKYSDMKTYNLNEQQQNAIVNGDGPVIVVAGAGSGKTRVLTCRVAYLINEKKVNPYNILAITFTNKAANEMKERITDMTENSQYLWMCTFHSMCVKILRADIEQMGYNRRFSIYSEIETERVIKKILDELEIGSISKKEARIEISWAKERALSFSQYKDRKPGFEIFAEIYKRYEEELLRSNALDFDDLLLKTVQLFVRHPDVLEKYQKRFKHILVDEFQDTNKIQYTLIKLLGQYHKNIFVVGDEDQSIYGWRGANIGNIKEFRNDFQDVKVFKLEQNYRSTDNILKCANSLIDNNAERTKKTLWTEKKGGADVIYKRVKTDRDEANFVINNIASLIRKGYKFNDFAILVRANSLTRLFEEGLNLYGYPYKVYGGYKFYERKEIKDVVAYLRIISNPKDNEAILRVINYPKRGIGEKAVESLLNYAEENNLLLIDVISAIENNPDLPNAVINKIAVFKDLILKLISASNTMDLKELIDYVVTEVGFQAIFSREFMDGKERLENIEELVSAIKMFYNDNRDANITDFLQSVSLMSDTDEIGNGQFITLTTIHSAKGLEFPVVFIAGLEEGIFPSHMSMNEDNIEEERRVMYVGVTRAKEWLILTSAESRYRFSEVQNLMPSRFINEMEFIEVKKRIRPNPEVKNNNSFNRFSYGNYTTPMLEKREEKDLSLYKSGVKVMHNRFGIGTIIEMKEENVAAIAFSGLGVKEFDLEIAPIKVMND